MAPVACRLRDEARLVFDEDEHVVVGAQTVVGRVVPGLTQTRGCRRVREDAGGEENAYNDEIPQRLAH